MGMHLLTPYLTRQRIAAALPYIHGSVLDFGCGIGSLCDFVPPQRYVGVDVNPRALENATRRHPMHQFGQVSKLDRDRKFDTVISLAVIEHVKDPLSFVRELKAHVAPNGQIIVTTPHPSLEWIHTLGAHIGLFSKEAHDEHEDLLDRSALEKLAESTDLSVVKYRRFLFGANQLIIYNPRS